MFYNAKLHKNVFPFDVEDGVEYDLSIDVLNCVVEVYNVDGDVIYSGQFIASPIKE